MYINVLTDPAIGGTFLSWSLYFLSGNEKYLYLKDNKMLDLTSNPLKGINAHGFQSNKVDCKEDLESIKHQIPSIKECNQMHVIYMHPYEQFDSPENECQSCMQYLIDNGQKNLLMSIPDSHPFYHWTYKGRTLRRKFSDPTKKNSNWDEQHQDFLKYFWGEDLTQWQEMGLVEVWDKREFLALNLRPYDETLKVTEFIPRTGNSSMYLDARDVWTSLDASIKEIMSWIGFDINQNRYTSWLGVYQQWKLYHYQRIRFAWYLPEIIESIIYGQDMDLKRFNLDIVQEAIVQHELIYKKGLNLKTFGLTEFFNTKQLHDLLESNFHPVENIYKVNN